MVHWQMLVQNMRGGNAWTKHAAFVAIDAREFHPIVLALTARLIDFGLPWRSPTLFIFALHDSFALDRPHQRLILTEGIFRRVIPGYFHLYIGRRVAGELFESVFRRDEEYSVLSGCDLSRWARSILEENIADG
jgi:hypothetical protein